MTSSDPARVRGRGLSSGGTRTDRPPDDGSKRASRARSASFFASDENMTSGSNHVVVAARFADGSGWVILDTYVWSGGGGGWGVRRAYFLKSTTFK